MSIEDTLLEMFTKPVARRGGLAVTILGIPTFKKYKPKAIENALGRLKNKQLLTFEGMSVVISAEGKQYLKNKKVLRKIFSSPFVA